MAISFVGFAALTLGLFALYAYLAQTSMERWALAGLAVTVVPLILYLPLLGVVTYVLPAVGGMIESGQTDAIAVLDRTWTDPFIVLPFLSGFLWHVGVALMGFAVWRSGSPSKWGGLVLVVASVLGIPTYFDVIVIQYLSSSVLAIGLIIVGLSLWNVGGSVDREL